VLEVPYMNTLLLECTYSKRCFNQWIGCLHVSTRKIVRWNQILCLFVGQNIYRLSVDLCHLCNGVPKFCYLLVSHFFPRNEQLTLECLWIFRENCLENIISLKFNRKSECFTRDHFTFVVTSPLIPYVTQKIWDTFQRKFKPTNFIQI
jgi:competence transcription factor ComK